MSNTVGISPAVMINRIVNRDATPLAGTESLHAPHPGVIVFVAQVGDVVQAGQTLAHVVDPLTPRTTPIQSSIAGVVWWCCTVACWCSVRSAVITKAPSCPPPSVDWPQGPR